MVWQSITCGLNPGSFFINKVFINKVLLEQLLFIYVLSMPALFYTFYTMVTELSACDRGQMAAENKIFTIWPLQRKLADLYSKS